LENHRIAAFARDITQAGDDQCAGYGARAGFGSRPALLVIDVSYAFCGDRPEPILESIKRWRNSCGAESWVAIGHIKRLIDKAHDRELPVIYTTGVRRADNWDSGGWVRKNSRSGEAPKTPSNRDGYDIVVRLRDPRHELRLHPDVMNQIPAANDLKTINTCPNGSTDYVL